MQLLNEISLRHQCRDLFGSFRTDQHFILTTFIQSLNQILTITICGNLTRLHHRKLFCKNFRRQDITTLDKFRCRNITNDLTINFYIIHPRLTDCERMFWRCRKEVTTVGFLTEVFSCREEVAFDRVMSFVKVNGVDWETSLLQFLQRVVGSEDQFVTASVHNPVHNLLRFGRTEVMRFTRVNVHHTCVGDKLQKLGTELFCEKNPRGHDNNRLRSFRLKLNHCEPDHLHCLTATSGDNNLTFLVQLH